MIGKVIDGKYNGCNVNKLPEKNIVYIQTESGEKIYLNKNTVESLNAISEETKGNCRVMVFWKTFETSVIEFVQFPSTPPEESVQSPKSSSTESAQPSDTSVSNTSSSSRINTSLLFESIFSNKKRIAFIVVAILIVAMIMIMGAGKKLSGSYGIGISRYEFIIQKGSLGEYGGECKEYGAAGILTGTYSWYIEDCVVYIDGDAIFGYYPKKDYIYDLDSEVVDITLMGEECIKDMKFLTETIYLCEDSGPYIIKDGILYVDWNGSTPDSEYLIVDEKYYEDFGGRV